MYTEYVQLNTVIFSAIDLAKNNENLKRNGVFFWKILFQFKNHSKSARVFILFVSAAVLFQGDVSLTVSLTVC